MWELDHKERWVPKNWHFQLWCWRRLLRVLWTVRSNQSVLKEINPEYSLEGLMLKMKLQYFGHLMWRADSLENTLMSGKIEGRRRMKWQDEIVGWHHWLDGHESEQTLGESEGQGAWCTAAHRVAKSWTRLRDWTKDRHYLFDPSITEKVKLKFPALLLNFIKMLLYSAITFVCVIVFQHCCGVHACVEFFYIFSGNWTFHYETFVFLYL